MKKSGFTLIELLIVVAIMGVLATIAIPKFHQVMVCGDKPNSEACRKLRANFQESQDNDVITVNGVNYRRLN